MQPVLIEDRITIAANTINENVIVSNASLRRFLRAPFRCAISVIATITATGLRIDFDHGAKNVIASADLRVGSDIQVPLDLVNDSICAEEGEQLVLRCANTTAGGITINYRIILEPIENLFAEARVMQRGPVAVANNTVDLQLLDGLKYERPPVDSLLTVFMTSSTQIVTRQLFVDSQSICPPSAVAANNRICQDPFDAIVEGVQVGEDKKVELTVSNSSGGAINVFWRTKLQELERA